MITELQIKTLMLCRLVCPFPSQAYPCWPCSRVWYLTCCKLTTVGEFCHKTELLSYDGLNDCDRKYMPHVLTICDAWRIALFLIPAGIFWKEESTAKYIWIFTHNYNLTYISVDFTIRNHLQIFHRRDQSHCEGSVSILLNINQSDFSAQLSMSHIIQYCSSWLTICSKLRVWNSLKESL